MRLKTTSEKFMRFSLGNLARSRGASLVEILFIMLTAGVVITGSATAYHYVIDAAAETRAISNIRSIITAQTAFHAQRGKFGSFEQLIDESLLSASFARNIAGAGASEAISDGRYDYSLRFERDALGFTLDADPKPAHAARYRRFRYRIRNSLDGQVGVILSASPSEASPPARAYQPLNN